MPIRFQDRAPVHAVIVEEAVRRHRLAPAIASLRHTHRRLHRQSLHQHPRALVQARITQIKLSEFQPSPVRRLVPQLRHAKARGKSKRDVETVSQDAAKSLKPNGIF